MDPITFLWPLFMLLLLGLMVFLAVIGVRLTVLTFRALKKYLDSEPQRQEQQIIRRSLGEVLKEHRTHCSMTQEFVAEAMGVSRQAVSKWESGASDPSTSNLLKLARLYGVEPEELIRSIQGE